MRGKNPPKQMPPHPARPKRRRGDITPEDKALWAHVARSAKPLPGRVHPEIAPEASPAIASSVDNAAAPSPTRITHTEKPQPRVLPPLVGVEKRLARALARGARTIDARIDLHGMRQAEAHQALHAFIHRAQGQGARIVLIITGKGGDETSGAMGEARGVLRRMVPHWLAEPALRRVILGFETAARGHGGEGALYVRLRRVGREP